MDWEITHGCCSYNRKGVKMDFNDIFCLVLFVIVFVIIGGGAFKMGYDDGWKEAQKEGGENGI